MSSKPTADQRLLYICIPAYNEADTIGVLLWKIRQVMAEFPRDYELLVLNDGSTDETDEVLEPYQRVLPLSVLHHTQRAGYAASLERLLREAVARSTHPRRDVVITLQADFTNAPDHIPALMKRLEGGADLVEAALSLDGSQAPRNVRWTRRVLDWLLRRMERPEGVRDPLSGFRAYRIVVLKKALAEINGGRMLVSEGWAANAELLLHVAPHLRRSEATDSELRYGHRQRESRVRPLPTVTGVWRMLRHRRPALRRLAAERAAAQTGGSQ